MTNEVHAIGVLSVALVIFVATVGRKLGFLSLSSLFLYSQYAMAIGIIPTLEEGHPADNTHKELLLFTFLSYVVCSILAISVLGRKLSRATYTPTVSFPYPAKWVACWILLSVLIGVAYYAAIGYVAFFESIRAITEGAEEDVAGLRIESYSGSRYLFPGYVNQFKNALLPALFLVVVTASFQLRKQSRWLTAMGLGTVTIILLIGTGQRHPMVKILIVAVLFLLFIVPKPSVRSIVIVTLSGMMLFIVTTFASGRATSELENATSSLDKIAVFFQQLVNRLFSSNQTSATVGFRYVHQNDSIPIAQEWIQALTGLLPGQPGSDLSHRIFDLMYGSTRGTAPLSLWGSAFYNFGFVWTVVFAGLLGISFAFVSSSFLRRNDLNLLQAVGMAGITMSLAMWIAGDPTAVFNNGIVVYVLLLHWGDRIQKRTRSTAQSDEKTPLRVSGYPPRRFYSPI